MNRHLKNLLYYVLFTTIVVTLVIYLHPLISAVLLVIVAVILWLRERKLEDEKYQFITIVAHKFRTPLTGIMWGLNELKKDISADEKTTILNELATNGHNLVEIVDLMAGFVRFDQRLSYAFEASSVGDMIKVSREKYNQAARIKNITFAVDMAPEMPLVVADHRKIQFVVDMLVENAVKYTPTNGTVSIVSKIEPDSIIVSVKDSGIGLSPEEVKHLFSKFFRADSARSVDTKGMGLGLYTARKIIGNHGGSLWAESEGKDKGTTFYLKLPTRRQ